MFMIMFVLDDTQFEEEILNSWSEIGIHGATIVESSGLYRRLKKIPMRYTFQSEGTEEVGNLTFFVMVESEEMVKRCLACVEKVVGDLDQPNTGIFSAWPLTMVKGIPTKHT